MIVISIYIAHHTNIITIMIIIMIMAELSMSITVHVFTIVRLCINNYVLDVNNNE